METATERDEDGERESMIESEREREGEREGGIEHETELVFESGFDET